MDGSGNNNKNTRLSRCDSCLSLLSRHEIKKWDNKFIWVEWISLDLWRKKNSMIESHYEFID